MITITNYNRVNADDLDLSQLGEYYLKWINAKIGNTLIFVNSKDGYYYYRIRHKNKSISDIHDMSIDDLQKYGLAAYPKLKNKNLAMLLLSEMN